MEEQVRDALFEGGVIDITTTGRKTGEARRIEVRLHNVDGELYLSGAPGPRSWYANMLASPRFTVHLKREVTADINALAEPIQEERERRRVFRTLLDQTGHLEQLEDRMTKSPLVRVSATPDSG